MKYDRMRAVVIALVGAEDAARFFKGGIDGVKAAAKKSITDFEEAYVVRWLTEYATFRPASK